MFGVLWSNLNDWYGVADPSTTMASAFRAIQGILIESRFYSLLGFLFGYGFGIQLLRAEERGVDVRVMFYRRMGALLAIGLATNREGPGWSPDGGAVGSASGRPAGGCRRVRQLE